MFRLCEWSDSFFLFFFFWVEGPLTASGGNDEAAHSDHVSQLTILNSCDQELIVVGRCVPADVERMVGVGVGLISLPEI